MLSYRYLFAAVTGLVTSIQTDFPGAGVIDNSSRGYVEVTVDDDARAAFDAALPAAPVLGPVEVVPGQGSLLTVCIPLGSEAGLRSAAAVATPGTLKTEALQLLDAIDAAEVVIPEL